MNREEAYALLKENLTNKNLLNHSLAVEAVMRRLAVNFDEDVEKWGLAGLLHDIDYDRTKDDPHRHSLEGSEMLAELGLPEDVVSAVKVHNHIHGEPRVSLMDKALFAVDPLTGFIVAGALIRPEKSLDAVEVPFLAKRFKEKAFARGANRETMATYTELELTFEEYLGVGLEAMKEISKEIGF
ncbi:MAG: HDIG domain-containing protein [Bacillota bacterium]|nr:HDIG domain-containing protein [Bacillota bacterium]